MAIDKLVPQYLNKDEDERLVKPFEMTDALNIRISHEGEGEQGIVRNVKGNTAILPSKTSDTVPASGENRVIGVTPCEAGKCMYFFLYNSLGNHGIYRYNSVLNKYEKIYQASVLNFERNGFVKGDVVINQEEEHLLYFTDNRNEPRKINATRALLNGYSILLNSGTDSQKEKFLTVCKEPPLTPATSEFKTNESLRANNLKSDVFQFAYQYVYDDGELSALSPYSKLAVSRTHLAYDTTTASLLQGNNNEIAVTVFGSDGPVKDIRVFARKGNDGAFFKIDEVSNSSSTQEEIVIFRNDQTYLYLDNQTANKAFDSVPRRALSQTVSNNRLMYGNYLEGFNNIKPDVYSYPVYGNDNSVEGAFNFTVAQEGEELQHTSVNNLINTVSLDYNSIFAEGYYPPYNGRTVATQLENAMFATNDMITGDITGDRIHFDVDISEFPVGGFDDELSPTAILQATLNCDKFGMVSRGTTDDVSIGFNVQTSEDGSLIHSRTMRLFTTNDHSNISNLKFDSPAQFASQFPISNIITKSDFAAAIIDGFINSSTNVGLSPGNIEQSEVLTQYYMDDSANGPSLLRTYNALLLPGNGDVFDGHPWINPADGNNDSPLLVKLQGAATMEVYEGTLLNEDTIRFYVRTTGLELDVTEAVALQFGSGNNVTHVNDFIDGSSLNDSPIGNLGTWRMYHIPSNKISGTLLGQQNSLGFSAIDTNHSPGNFITSMLFGYKPSGSVDVFSASDSVQSFKCSANHELGIVYLDHRGRASGVQKSAEVSVANFGHFTRNGNNGATQIDMRLMHSPPDWAERWAPVYSKNTTYESILQTTVAEAALGRSVEFTDSNDPDGNAPRRVVTGLEGGIRGQIFLSLRGLEGKTESYKDFKGALTDYKYQDGDVLRVLQYTNESGIVVRPNFEFAITSYKFYNDDEFNPVKISKDSVDSNGVILKDENAYRRTGWFLSIRDNDTAGFSRSLVNTGRDYFSQRCLVEIYRPLKQVDQRLYYEVGETYPIISVGGVKTHGGDRSNTVSPTFSMMVEASNKFISSERLFLGDKILSAASPSGYAFIESITPIGNSSYRYKIHSSNLFALNTIGTTVGSNTISATGSGGLFPGVVTLNNGDVFMRLREQLVNFQSAYTPQSDVSFLFDPTKPDNQSYQKFIVEDSSVSDFFPSKYVSIGRPFIETPEQKEVARTTAITYSDPYVSDSSVLNLSSFNPTLFPYKDFGSQYGKICFLIDSGEAVTILQEQKVGKVPVNRTLIESAGDGQLVTSSNVLGTETYYAGSYGPGLNPESVVQKFGIIYFCDIESGKVIEISSKGIKPISDTKMESFFEGLFADLIIRESVPRVPCGIDPENSELIVTSEGQQVNDITFGSTDIGDIPIPDTDSVIASSHGMVKPIVSIQNQMTWEKDPLTWNSTVIDAARLPQWDKVGSAIMFCDRLTERSSVFIEPDLRAKVSTIEVDLITSDYSFRGVGQLSPRDGSVKFPDALIAIAADASNDASSAVSIAAGTDDSGKTIAWSTSKDFWLSLYSFNPEMYGNLSNRFFSFEGGQIYRHNVNSTRNNFYGTQYNSVVELISKKNPSSVKVYNAISLEGNDTWAGVVTNSNQTTSIPEAMYEEKEGIYYTNIPNDVSVDANDSVGTERVVLGEVSALSSNFLDVTFTGRVSNLPFGIGDSVKVISGSGEQNLGLTITSVLGRNKLRLSGAAIGQIGNTLVAVSSDVINGEQMRDYYAKIKLTSDNTAEKELYAVNAIYTASPLDNSQTN